MDRATQALDFFEEDAYTRFVTQRSDTSAPPRGPLGCDTITSAKRIWWPPTEEDKTRGKTRGARSSPVWTRWGSPQRSPPSGFLSLRRLQKLWSSRENQFFLLPGGKRQTNPLRDLDSFCCPRLRRRLWLLPPALQDLRLPPSLHLRPSRSQRCRWAPGWRSFAPPGDCVPPTPPPDLEGHRENRSLPKEPRHEQGLFPPQRL